MSINAIYAGKRYKMFSVFTKSITVFYIRIIRVVFYMACQSGIQAHRTYRKYKSAERPSIIIHDRISFSERNWAIHSKSCKTLIKHEWKHNMRLEIQKIPTHACNSRLYLVAATGNGGTVRHVYLLFIR